MLLKAKSLLMQGPTKKNLKTFKGVMEKNLNHFRSALIREYNCNFLHINFLTDVSNK